LLGLWSAPAVELADRIGADVRFPNQAGMFVATVDVTIVTGLLLAFPAFCAEAWLVICQVTRREQARRLAVPFGIVSAGAALLALWLACQVDVSYSIEL
jgi:Sec-independent protein secretion pathway component TatC